MSLRWQYGRIFGWEGRRNRWTRQIERWIEWDRYGWKGWVDCNLGLSFRPYPGLNWWRRLKQWYAVLAEESMLQASGKPSLWKMWRAWRTGEVTRAKWRARLRRCRRCPVFDGELRRCRGPQMPWSQKWVETKQNPDWMTFCIGDLRYGHWEKVSPPPPAGCGCYVPFLALTKQPYTGPSGSGCWGRAVYGGDFGWE